MSKKLSAKFVGPFKISRCVSSVAYHLDLPGMMHIHPVSHISLLQCYKDLSVDHDILPKPLLVTVDGELEYEVQDVVQKRVRKKRIEYLVHWEGYPDYDVTWEPVTNL